MLVSKKNNTSTTSTKEIASRVMSRYSSRYGLNDFDLELTGFEENFNITGDIEQVCSMLAELLCNAAVAIKYLKSKGKDIDFSLHLRCQLIEDNKVLFEIKNPSEKHTLKTADLLLPGISEHFVSKQPIGIGLTAVFNTASRFNGYFNIFETEEIDNDLPEVKHNIFVSNLVLPLA